MKILDDRTIAVNVSFISYFDSDKTKIVLKIWFDRFHFLDFHPDVQLEIWLGSKYSTMQWYWFHCWHMFCCQSCLEAVTNWVFKWIIAISLHAFKRSPTKNNDHLIKPTTNPKKNRKQSSWFTDYDKKLSNERIKERAKERWSLDSSKLLNAQIQMKERKKCTTW